MAPVVADPPEPGRIPGPVVSPAAAALDAAAWVFALGVLLVGAAAVSAGAGAFWLRQATSNSAGRSTDNSRLGLARDFIVRGSAGEVVGGISGARAQLRDQLAGDAQASLGRPRTR